MFYAIIATDIENSLEKRLAARPAHLERLNALRDEGRLLLAGPHPAIDSEDPGETGFSGSLIVAEFGSLEDTFSSDAAVNLDQADPLAEADFHMAYGLYDQAADLITGALESDPGDQALMSKLCEIYFVWGNRDAFVDAATRVKQVAGDSEAGEWDKIVIMGQQMGIFYSQSFPEKQCFIGLFQ